MTDTLVKVDNVSKKFCRSLKRSLWYGMQDLGSELVGRRHGGNGELRPDEFWALKDISFELKRGECLGLIGRNGAGKTTLLRMLNGLIKPDGGRIEMRGRVGALIALGAGFNPILTGRENIYVNAAVLGLTKPEIDVKFDEIVDFAELENFIDAPVQTYSSGMVVRLGFAIAAKTEPDILLLDEVLAVGDARFQAKCANVIKSFTSIESAVVLVSHNEHNLMRYCNTALCIEKSVPVSYGKVSDVLNVYRLLGNNSQAAESNIEKYTGKVTVTQVSFIGFDGKPVESISWQTPLIIKISVNSHCHIERIMAELVLTDTEGLLFREVYGPIEVGMATEAERHILFKYDQLMVSSGVLRLGVALWDEAQSELLGTSRNNCVTVANQTAQPGRLMLPNPEMVVT